MDRSLGRARDGLVLGVVLALTTFAWPAAAAPRSCRGHTATIVGSPNSDRLRGTPGRDVIVALGGNDEIHAGGGGDIVCGGRGNDLVFGGAGRDRLYGGSGKDSLLGHTGRDRLFGESGDDTLVGWLNSDRLAGGAGTDGAHFGTFGITQSRRIVADLAKGTARGEGKDVLVGIENLTTNQFECGCAGVTFLGDDGPNVLRDFGSNYATDIFKGRGGDDMLVANTGPDRLYGQAGDDRMIIGLHNDDETDGEDEFRGGRGTDTADYSDPYMPPGAVTVDLAAETATGPQIETDLLAGIENVIGTPGDDVLSGDAGPNRLRGGEGADELSGNGGDDHLNGGAGENTNNGGDGTDECINPDSSAGAVDCET